MESIETGGGAFSSRVDEIKKDILDRTIKKINGILKKTDEIHKMNVEFYGPMENMRCQKTTAEQEQKSKKIGTFLRGVEKRRGEILKEREEIFAIIDALFELSKIEIKNPEFRGLGRISWMEIRREIKKKMEKILIDGKQKK